MPSLTAPRARRMQTMHLVVTTTNQFDRELLMHIFGTVNPPIMSERPCNVVIGGMETLVYVVDVARLPEASYQHYLQFCVRSGLSNQQLKDNISSGHPIPAGGMTVVRSRTDLFNQTRSAQ
ncbi:MAG: hypothetical protein NVV63_12670 [Opitutus sp.]|nr:hypothetical protein [Opitutus sp.]